MKRAYLFLMILFVAFACEDQEAAPNTLSGKWEWVRTDGGIANHIHDSPQSSGKTITLVLEQNLSYQKYLDGALTTQGTYSLVKKKCIHDHQEKELIVFSADQALMVEKLNDHTLYLSDENYDGLDSQYRRVGAAGKEN